MSKNFKKRQIKVWHEVSCRFRYNQQYQLPMKTKDEAMMDICNVAIPSKIEVQLEPTKKEKTYKVRITHDRRGERIVEGTLHYLVNQYFGYTLEIGHSHNARIQRHPKTIKSFISNLQRSYDEKEAACYDRTFVELVK